jgi:hypothetical protein
MKSGRNYNISSFKQISDYLSDILSQHEKNRLERQAMSDPFEADALEGFSTLSPKALHADMAELRHKIYQHQKRRLSIPLMQIAAVIIVLLIPSFATWYIIKNIPKPQPIVQAIIEEPEPVVVLPIYKPPKRPATKREALRFSPPVINPEIEEELIITFDDEVQELTTTDKLDDLVSDMATAEPMENSAPAAISSESKRVMSKSKKILAPADKIQGSITDENGEPLAGVAVRIKDTEEGTITDLNGEFSLKSDKKNAVLETSYVGYKTEEHPISKDSSIYIAMVPENIALNEVVAIGYGTKKQRSMTGSVSSIESNKAFKNKPSKPKPIIGVSGYKRYLKNEIANRHIGSGKNVVIAEITIDSRGSVKNVKIIEATNAEIAREITKIIEAGSQWECAKLNGIDVEGTRNIKVVFKQK